MTDGREGDREAEEAEGGVGRGGGVRRVGRGGECGDLVLQAEELRDDDAEDGEAEGDAEVGEVGAFEG